MAKNSKGYSTGGAGKKFLIAIGALVLVAIIIVIILLCIPPNTYNAVQTLNRTTQTTFLVSETENENLKNFEKKFVYDQYARNELQDVQNLAEISKEILEFYNSNILYATNNKNLKNNYKPIKNNLNKAKSHQNKMNKILISAKDVSSDSTSLNNYLKNFRKEFVGWLTSYQKAFAALNRAYTGSMGNILANNPAAKLILNTVDDYFTVISNVYSKIGESDQAGNTVNYQAIETWKVWNLKKFVNVLSSSSSPINSYYFDQSVQERYEKLNSFFELYGETDLTAVIETASSTGFTKIYIDIEDTQNVYNDIKAFLGGERI